MDSLSIDLGRDVPPEVVKALREEIAEIEAVERAIPNTTRSADPQALMLWVQVATGAVTALAGAVPVVRALIEAVRRKGIRGAKIRLPNGAEVAVDEADPQQLERLLAQAGGYAAPPPASP